MRRAVSKYRYAYDANACNLGGKNLGKESVSSNYAGNGSNRI